MSKAGPVQGQLAGSGISGTVPARMVLVHRDRLNVIKPHTPKGEPERVAARRALLRTDVT